MPIIVGGSGERRTLDIAARLGDGCNLPSAMPALQHKLGVLRGHLGRPGRDPALVRITVLDVPIIGRDNDDVVRLVEKHRGRQRAAAYAAAGNAGTITDHIGRYRQLADLGVDTVFLALPTLSGPAEIEQFKPIVDAFA